MSETEYWGYHLMINAGDCDRSAVTNKNVIYNFCKALVSDIDMVAYGEPQIVHFGEDNKAGYTLVQLIETSNICAHFCDHSGDLYLDVFSCKTFEQEKVINLVKSFFSPNRFNTNYVERQA